MEGTKAFLLVEGEAPEAAGIRLGENNLAAARDPLLHLAPGAFVRQALPLIPERRPGLVLFRPDQLLLAHPMVTVDEPEAAPGKAIEVPLHQGRDVGTAQARFAITQAGDYRVWAKVYAPSGESNSYWLAIDAAAPALVDVNALAKWAWGARGGPRAAGAHLHAGAGEHHADHSESRGRHTAAAIVLSNGGEAFDAAKAWE